MEWILLWLFSAPICFYLMTMASKAEKEVVTVKVLLVYLIVSFVPVLQQLLIVVAACIVYSKLDTLETVVFDFSKKDDR